MDEWHPNIVATRAHLVAFLWKLEGEPTVDSELTFEDVADNAWYAEAIRWAAANGIVYGYNGNLNPEGKVTREQVVTILYRYAEYIGMDTTQGGMLIREFNDYDSISSYAIEAMQWAVNAGIMQGYNNNLMPTAECTRAQIVTILYRLLGK